jgi:hypothetical protein
MRPEVTPLSPLPIHFITFFAAQRSNQGLVHHLAGQQQLFIGPALDQVPIGHAARVWGLVGAAVLHGDAAVGVGNEAAFAQGPGFKVGVGGGVHLAEVAACAFGVELFADGAGDEALQVVERGVVHLADGGCAHVKSGQRGRCGQLGGQHLHHGFDHIVMRRYSGGHAACLRLDGAADFDKARFDGASAAVVVVVLALAQTSFAGAPAHVAVGRVCCVRIQADHQARGIDQLVKGLAPFGQEQFVVQVVGGLCAFLAHFAFNDQHKRAWSAHAPLGVGKVQHRVAGFRGCGGAGGRGLGHDEGSVWAGSDSELEAGAILGPREGAKGMDIAMDNGGLPGVPHKTWLS